MDTNDITRQYLDSLLIEERLIDSVLPTIKVSIWGKEYSTPIMTPAFSHLGKMGNGRETGMVEYARAAKKVDTLNWVGMEPDDVFADIMKAGADTVRIIKPFADHDKILEQIEFAENHGAVAVGIDIDHVYGYDGQYDVLDGETMGAVSAADIREYVNATQLPFVIKGVLSTADAEKCAKCGVKGIVVSHHHGRMPFAVPPLMVLPQIREAVLDSGMQIFVDCHIDTGIDAFKALALGADAVSVGRAMMEPLKSNGVEGVIRKLSQMSEELVTMMGYTGFRTVSEIEPSVIWKLQKAYNQ